MQSVIVELCIEMTKLYGLFTFSEFIEDLRLHQVFSIYKN